MNKYEPIRQIQTDIFPAGENPEKYTSDWAKGRWCNLFPLHRVEGRWVNNCGDALYEGFIYRLHWGGVSGLLCQEEKHLLLRNGELFDVTALVDAVSRVPCGEEVSCEREWETGGGGYEHRWSKGGLTGKPIRVFIVLHRTARRGFTFYRLPDGEILIGTGNTCGRGYRWSNHRVEQEVDRQAIETLIKLCVI